MTTSDFTTTILVGQTPGEAFHAIKNIREWWSQEIEGNTSQINEVFNYHYEDIHRCQMKLVEIVPDQKLIWQVTGNYFKPGIFNASDDLHSTSTNHKSEWVDTQIIFEITEKDNQTEIRFTHLGLTPKYECYNACSQGWSHYIRNSLKALIETGKGQPNATGTARTATEKKLSE